MNVFGEDTHCDRDRRCRNVPALNVASASRGPLICGCDLISANWLIGTSDTDDTAMHVWVCVHAKRAEESAREKEGTIGSYIHVPQSFTELFEAALGLSSTYVCLVNLFFFFRIYTSLLLIPFFFRVVIFSRRRIILFSVCVVNSPSFRRETTCRILHHILHPISIRFEFFYSRGELISPISIFPPLRSSAFSIRGPVCLRRCS